MTHPARMPISAAQLSRTRPRLLLLPTPAANPGQGLRPTRRLGQLSATANLTVLPGPYAEPPATYQSPTTDQPPEDRLRALMVEVGVPETLATSLADTALVCARVEADSDGSETPASDESAPASVGSAQALLSAVETVSQLSAHLDAVMLSATAQLTRETGKVLLADKGLTDPGDLSQTARARWRARAKSLTRHEIAAALGWSAGEVIDLVALANAPSAVVQPVCGALRRAEVPWRLARRYHRACSGLPHEDAAAIATALFGDDPQSAVTERLTSDGDWSGEPWHHKEFYRALDREVAKIRARDPEREATKRRAARDRADMRVNLNDDGSAEVMIGCLTLQGAAIADRIEHAARAIRKAGDPRTLAHLRSAVATALLLHGQVDLGGLSDDPDTVTVEESAQLAKILHGLPTADLNVIVPFTMLANPTAPTCECHSPSAPTAPTARSASTDASSQPPRGHPPFGQLGPPDDTGVAEVVGRHSAFLTAHDVHELMLTPGSVLHRLITDPTTGRCLERSTDAYRFTAAQRAQIIAADVFCRAPGCLHPGALSQIDHVREHGTPGGETREANGQLAHEAHHDLKTKKAWQASINESREVTWKTLLGRIYRTKAHDYRQYTDLLHSAIAAIDGDDPTDPDAPMDGDQERAAGIDQAIHTALSYRPPGETLEAVDDWDESERQFLGWSLISLFHETAQGRRRYGPHPDLVATERKRLASTRTAALVDSSAPDPSTPNTSAQDYLQVDPSLYEGAPRLDDPSLLDGPPVAPPDGYSRYTRDEPGTTDGETPPF